jgi:hypothetical protein
MAESYRVTTLSAIYTCWYKTKNEPYEPDIKKTYHWDILNVYANGKWKAIKKFVAHWQKHIEPDIVLGQKLEMVGQKAHDYIQKQWDTRDDIMQEAQMFLYYWPNKIEITGTPDLHYFNQDLWLWVCEDLKCSTHSYYTWDDMREYNLQTRIYPLFIMNYQWVDEVWFRYIVADKKTGKLKSEPSGDGKTRDSYVIRTREQCELKLQEVMDDYVLPYMHLDVVQARRNKLCNFCKFKDTTCPLKRVMSVVSKQAEADDLL